jgi:hypothetical protein
MFPFLLHTSAKAPGSPSNKPTTSTRPQTRCATTSFTPIPASISLSTFTMSYPSGILAPPCYQCDTIRDGNRCHGIGREGANCAFCRWRIREPDQFEPRRSEYETPSHFSNDGRHWYNYDQRYFERWYRPARYEYAPRSRIWGTDRGTNAYRWHNYDRRFYEGRR